MDGVSALQMVFQTTVKRSCWVLIFIDNIEIIFNSSELHIISEGALRLLSFIYIWCRCNSTYVFLTALQWQLFSGHQTRSNLISISKWFFQWYILLIKNIPLMKSCENSWNGRCPKRHSNYQSIYKTASLNVLYKMITWLNETNITNFIFICTQQKSPLTSVDDLRTNTCLVWY